LLIYPGRAGADASGPGPGAAHDTFTVASRALGEPRLINVHVPAGYSAGTTIQLPVLYMPDGASTKTSSRGEYGRFADRPARIRPVIVVGIPNTERRRDLTGPTRLHSDSAIARTSGALPPSGLHS